MSQPFESLFWAPHAPFHRRLQDGSFTKASLDDHYEWLLQGTQKFKPCNESSRKHIMEKLKVEVKGKSFVYDPKLRPLALRAAKLLDLDEMQTMLLLKRWLKDNEPDLKPEQLPENDPMAINELILQLLRSYHTERVLLLKCLQVVMLKAGAHDEPSRALADVLSRLVKANIEEQLHTRLRENLEGAAAAITRRLKASEGAGAAGAVAGGAAAPAMPAPTIGTAAHAAFGASILATVPGGGGGGILVSSASLGWLSAAHSEMRSQLLAERLELLNCLLLLYEICGVPCKPERAQALARLLLDRVFVSVQHNGGGGGVGGGSSNSEPMSGGGGGAAAAATDVPTALSQQLAALLLLSCLDLPGYVRLATAVAPPPAAVGGAVETQLPLGGKTMDVHNQISQYAASPSTALLLLTWAGCLRLIDASGAGHMIRDLDGAARELEVRVGAAGGLTAAAAALTTLFAGAVGAVLLVYRDMATKALCVMCTAFDLGVDTLDAATYDMVAALLKLCVEGDARACAALWDESQPSTAPLRALLAAAARLFPAAPHHLLQLLRLTAASPESARAAYAFLQRNVSLVVLHSASEPAIRQLGGGEVELAAALPWNLAPSVPGLALPQGCVGMLYPLPAVLSELRGRYMLVAWDAEVSGGGGHSRGQVLLLGRASHCVASLEHSLLHNLPLLDPSDPALLRDLSDILSLLATLCAHEPALAHDLLTQSVRFGVAGSGAGTTLRSWTDVVAGVLAIGPQLAARLAATSHPQQQPHPPTSALQLLADAAQLLATVSAVAPGRVLSLLPLLPLLASPAQDLLAGLPAAVPLASLPAFQVPRCVEAFCGLLPALSALQRDLERPAGRYPLTGALLGLLAGLLERGFVAAPLPAAVLFVLHEVLPNHHHWRYADAKERWALTRGSLRVLRLALTAGAFVSDPDLTALVAPALPLAATSGSAAGPLMLTYGGAASGGAPLLDDGGGAAAGSASAGASLTPDQILSAAAPRLHVSVLSAALLKLLLLHGGVLLAHSLPPPAETLEHLRAEDPSRPELPSLEQCASELVQLVPPLLAAACAHPQEQPFEEFLLSGQDPTPAAHVASYIAYHEGDRDVTPPERQISYLALRALLSIAACIARAVPRSLPAASLALALPAGSPAEACLRALLRGDAAAAHPAHFALAAQLAADAVGVHDELLVALLFPSELEGTVGAAAAGAGAGTGGAPVLALPAPAGGAGAAAGGAAGGGAGGEVVVRRAGRSRQALDGLYAMMQRAAALKREQPEVLAAALRVLSALWHQPAAAHRAVSALRSAPDLWTSLEACLTPVRHHGAVQPDTPAVAAAAGGVAAATADSAAHQTLCEALALRILTAEAFARSRAGAAAAAAADAAGAATTSGPYALLDKAVKEGLLMRLLRSAAATATPAPLGPTAAAAGVAEAVGPLQQAVAALYLEMGARVVSELWGPPGEPDGVALAGAVREELAGVRALLAQGLATEADIHAVHDELLGLGGLAGLVGQTQGSPGGLQFASGEEAQMLLPPGHPLAQLVTRQCLGAALVRRCHVATTDLAQGPGGPAPPSVGPAYLLSRPRLLAALGPAAELLQSADLVGAAMSEVSSAASLEDARMALLFAATSLTGILARDGRLSSSGPATAAALLEPGSGLLAVVQSVCGAAVGSLLAWSASPDSRAALQPDWGLCRLHANQLAAALAASRLMLSAMQAARQALTAAPGSGGGGGAASSAGPGSGTPPRPPPSGGAGGGNSVFGAPIAVTPIATALRTGGGRGTTTASGGGGTAARDPSYLPFVVQLAQQLSGWSRVLVSAGVPQCPPQAALQVTDALGGALLLGLQPLPADAAGAEEQQAEDRQQLAAVLLSTVPQLCELAASGGISTPLAAQLLLEFTRHLATHDWLPLLLANLDMGQHILAAAGRAATIAAAAAAGAAAPGGADAAAAAGDLGTLALALVVAQVPDGARVLYDRGIVDQLVAAGRHLLSSSGGRLASFSVIAVTGTGPYRPTTDGTYPAAAVSNGGGGGVGFLTRGSAGELLLQAAPPADTCGAYLPATLSLGGVAGAEIWSPVHRQWCTQLQFSAALLRTLGQYLNLEREALDLLLALEPRLMLAVLPPGGDMVQPLTLAGLVELEAALFLLAELTAYLGGWHMVLPASLLNFRTAVSTLLTWLAQPTLTKSFALDCRPRTTREVALAATPAPDIPSADGWFRACTAGAAAAAGGTAGLASAAGGAGGAAGAAASGGGGGLGSPIAGAIPSASPTRSFSEVLGGGSGGLPGTPGPGTPGGGGGCGSIFGGTPSRSTSGLGAVALGVAGTGTVGVGGVGGGGGGGGVCSEYSAQMAEKLYTCAYHGLSFLVASSPQLSPGEAASLGPAWPRPRDLAALLDQCMCASQSLAHHHPEAPASTARRNRIVRLLARVGQLSANFLNVLSGSTGGGGGGGGGASGVIGGAAPGGGAGGGGGGGSAREQQAREWLASLELGGSGGFGPSLGPQAVTAA